MFRHIFEDVAWLAVQMLADGFKRRETDRSHLSRLEERNVRLADANRTREFIGSDFALGENDIQANDDRHGQSNRERLFFVGLPSLIHDPSDDQQNSAHNGRHHYAGADADGDDPPPRRIAEGESQRKQRI